MGFRAILGKNSFSWVVFALFLEISFPIQSFARAQLCSAILSSYRNVFKGDPYLSSTFFFKGNRGIIEDIAVPYSVRPNWISEKSIFWGLQNVEIRNLKHEHIVEVYESLGNSVAFIAHGVPPSAREQVYQSYLRQGVERSGIVDMVRAQDTSESPLVTQFLTLVQYIPVAHGQVLVSPNPSVKLHIEHAWPGKLGNIGRRNPKERIGEIGRLLVHHPHRQFLDWKGEWVEEIAVGRAEMDFLFSKNLYEMIQWSLFQANLDRVVIQIKPSLERMLIAKRLPLFMGERVEVSETYTIKGKTVEITEVIYSFDRDAMNEISKHLMINLFKRWALEIKTEPQLANLDYVLFKFHSRDLKTLERTGIVNFGRVEDSLWTPRGRPSFFLDPLGRENKGEFELHIEVSRLSELIDFLNRD